MLHSTVQDKCRRISVCLSKLDNRLVATNLNHMLWADMVRPSENKTGGYCCIVVGYVLKLKG